MTQNNSSSFLEKTVVAADTSFAKFADKISPNYEGDNSAIKGSLMLYAGVAPSMYAFATFSLIPAAVTSLVCCGLATAAYTTTNEDHAQYSTLEPHQEIPKHLLKTRRDFAQAVLVMGTATIAQGIARLVSGNSNLDGPLIITSALLAATSAYYFTPRRGIANERAHPPSFLDF